MISEAVPLYQAVQFFSLQITLLAWSSVCTRIEKCETHVLDILGIFLEKMSEHDSLLSHTFMLLLPRLPRSQLSKSRWSFGFCRKQRLVCAEQIGLASALGPWSDYLKLAMVLSVPFLVGKQKVLKHFRVMAKASKASVCFSKSLFLGAQNEVPATDWQMFWNSPEMVLPEVRERCGLENALGPRVVSWPPFCLEVGGIQDLFRPATSRWEIYQEKRRTSSCRGLLP